MAITSVVLNCADIGRSLDFYTRFLGARPIGEPSADRARLDLGTGTIELRSLRPRPPASTWLPDDLQLGFRHVGFKVDDLDRRAAELRAAGVPFHLDPLDAEGGVRICFFYDPDHTLLEFVQGDLQYAQVLDPDGVERERALGVPERPRLDHVATTVQDSRATAEFYRDRFGFSLIGTVEQPQDRRGFRISYLKAGDTVLEVFAFDVARTSRPTQLDAPGFSHLVLSRPAPNGARIAAASSVDASVRVDGDGLAFAVGG